MRKNWMLVFCLVGWHVLCALVANASENGVTFSYARVNVPGAVYTIPFAINNAGVIVGNYYVVDPKYHQFFEYGFILDDGQVTRFEPPGAAKPCLTVCSAVSGINLKGAVSVIGTYQTNAGVLVGFLYKGGNFTNITGPIGSLDSVAMGINDDGNIVGYYYDQNHSSHGFLLEKGRYRVLDVPGALSTFATAINDSGEIVLLWEDANGKGNASLYHGGAYTTINVPEAAQSEPTGINSSGDIVFAWYDAIGVEHGALLHGGEYYDFDYPGQGGTVPSGINDFGNIMGYALGDQLTPGFLGIKVTYKPQ